MNCPNCGRENTRGKNFCTNCGQKLNIKINLIVGIIISIVISILVYSMEFLLYRYCFSYGNMWLYTSWSTVNKLVLLPLLIFINLICYFKLYKNIINAKPIIISIFVSYIISSLIFYPSFSFIELFLVKYTYTLFILEKAWIITVTDMSLAFMPLFKTQEIIYFVKNNYKFLKEKRRK